ncbi:MAG: TetR family transcriptional regulator [Aureispira sp.]
MTATSNLQVEQIRTLLQKSLVTLLDQRTYRNISIQQILEQANVNRSTLYTYFPSKNALLYSLNVQHHWHIQLETALLEEKAMNLLNLLFKRAEQAYATTEGDNLSIFLQEIGYWVKVYMKDYSERSWRNYPDLELWQTVAQTSVSSAAKIWLEQGAQDRKAMAEKMNEVILCCLGNAQQKK